MLKYLFTIVVVTIGIYFSLGCIERNPQNKNLPTKPTISTGKGFAILELFTSQGCSSCPSAEEVLNTWVKKAKDEHLNVYPLAFHVDYWDRLGWKDPYASNKFTNRQSYYAGTLSESSVYTPQLVINGTKQLVGSRATEITKLVENEISAKATTTIALSWLGIDKSKLHYQLNEIKSDCAINIAIVQDGLITKVPKGENSGRTLPQDGVVLNFQSQNCKNISGDIDLEMSLNSTKYIVAYIQNNQTGEIIAASKLE